MIFYRHGSGDSLDIDIHYVFDKLPSFKECQKFCSDKEENRNIIVINNGIVVECFKGTNDEINNGLLDTYNLHPQEFDNIVKERIERDVLIKTIRVMRCLLSHFSRTQYRDIVKLAIKSNSWKKRIETLRSIDFYSVDDFNKVGSKQDVYKIFAFQLGQVMALFDNEECYTKSSVANKYPDLYEFLYRKEDVNLDNLNKFVELFLDIVSDFKIKEYDDFVYFEDFDKKINLKNEKYL